MNTCTDAPRCHQIRRFHPSKTGGAKVTTFAVLALGLTLLASPLVAKPGTPGPAYFAGTYERVGREGGPLQATINDSVVIEPVGQWVAIRGCTGAEVLMSFGPAFEMVNLMTGSQAGVAVECLFHNNGYNRPILTCRADDGGAFTLWPVADAALACGG